MAAKLTCPTCGYSTTSATPARAEYGQRRHSCAKHLNAAARRARTVRRYQETATEKPCTHQTHHPHGTNARAALDGCKCKPCRDAAYKATKQWRVRVATQGHVNVDATPALEHIRRLQAGGLGWKRIARMAGVANTSVYALLYGRPDRNGGQPSTKARRETVDKILAVPLPSFDELGARVAVPAVGTRRRLQALATLGWSMTQIADRAGLTDRQPLDKAMHGPVTGAATARAVRDVYDQLWDTPPTAADRFEQGGITRVQKHAARNGWAPPLAWDDESIDAPDATPDLGDKVRATGRPGVDLDEFLWLISTGEAPDRAAARLGVLLRTVETAARRHGRDDVLAHTNPGRETAA